MNIEEIRDYALSLADATETFPFGEDTLVYKVNNKIFLLMGMNAMPLEFNVKCDPELAIQLRDEYACVRPGYHMNKKHWNTVTIDGTLTSRQLRNMIQHSYQLVAPKKKKG